MSCCHYEQYHTFLMDPHCECFPGAGNAVWIHREGEGRELELVKTRPWFPVQDRSLRERQRPPFPVAFFSGLALRTSASGPAAGPGPS